MKVWINSRNWPFPIEKYRYPIEQMLVTLFPGEKFEYLYGKPEGLLPPEGDMSINFIRDGHEIIKKFFGAENVHVIPGSDTILLSYT